MRKLSVLLTLLLLTGVVFASTTTYSDRASFYAANPGVTIEGWDGLPSGTLITVLNGITYTTNDGTAQVTNLFLPLSTPNTLGEDVNGFFLASDLMTLRHNKRGDANFADGHTENIRPQLARLISYTDPTIP